MELIVCDEKENWLAHNSPSGKGTGRETLSSSPHNPNAASAQSVNGRQGLLVQSLAACMPHKHDDDDEIFFGEVRTVERTKQARLKTHDSPSGKGTGRAQTLSSSPHNPNAAVLASVQSVENHQGLLAQSFAVCMPHKHEDDDEIFFGKVRTIERTKQSRLKTHALSPNVPAKPKFANDDRTVAGGHPEEDDEVEVFFGPRTELERSLHHVISRKRRRTMLLPRRGQFPDTEDRIAAAIIIQVGQSMQGITVISLFLSLSFSLVLSSARSAPCIYKSQRLLWFRHLTYVAVGLAKTIPATARRCYSSATTPPRQTSTAGLVSDAPSDCQRAGCGTWSPATESLLPTATSHRCHTTMLAPLRSATDSQEGCHD